MCERKKRADWEDAIYWNNIHSFIANMCVYQLFYVGIPMQIPAYLKVPVCRPTQLVTATVRWTYRRQEEGSCTMTSLLCPMSPASKAVLASQTKAWDISNTSVLVCVGKRWEAWITLCFFFLVKKFSLLRVLTRCVSLTEQRSGCLCGQCNRKWNWGQRLHLSVHGHSLWHQESERGFHPVFPHWWLTDRCGLRAAPCVTP